MQSQLSFTPMKKFLPSGVVLFAVIALSHAGTPPVPEPSAPDNESAIADWWNGKYASGNWFGVRDTLEDHGVYFDGKWRGTFYGSPEAAWTPRPPERRTRRL